MTFFIIELEIGNTLKNPCDYMIRKSPRLLTFHKGKTNFHRNRVHKHCDS